MKTKIRFVITLLIFIMTVITFILGTMMYHSNLKKTEQNVIGVELADFIYNINYSMQFGKNIETFYGMEQQLDSLKEHFEDIEELYIISADNQILFLTADQMPNDNISSMSAGENKISGHNLYCMYQLNEKASVLVKSNAEAMQAKMMHYLKNLAWIAFAGVAFVNLLVIIFWNALKSRKKAFQASFILLVIWILCFGTFIGFGGYQVYSESLDTVFEAIRSSVKTDFEQILHAGVPEDRIFEIEQYLARYTDMIPEVESIQADQTEVICIASETYRQKVILDYGLQTVLLLTFSILILTEYRLFVFSQPENTEQPQEQIFQVSCADEIQPIEAVYTESILSEETENAETFSFYLENTVSWHTAQERTVQNGEI